MSHRLGTLGFTLLEVLVALAVFAVVAVGLLHAANENIRTSSYVEDRLTAVWLAETRLNAVRALGEDKVRQGTRSEYFAGREWSVSIRLSEGERFGATKVGIEVMRKESGDVLAHLEGYL